MIWVFGTIADCELVATCEIVIIEAVADVDDVVAKDVFVDATSELRRQLQETGGSCIRCGTAGVSFVHFDGQTCAYIFFWCVEDLLRFKSLDGRHCGKPGSQCICLIDSEE